MVGDYALRHQEMNCKRFAKTFCFFSASDDYISESLIILLTILLVTFHKLCIFTRRVAILPRNQIYIETYMLETDAFASSISDFSFVVSLQPFFDRYEM